MNLKIKKIRKQDYHYAIDFAIKGMHFDWYLKNKWLLQLYGRYFWYLELNRATQIIALYADDVLAGVLLAKINGEKNQHNSFFQKIYIKIFEVLQNYVAKDSVTTYGTANNQMLLQYLKGTSPDGEIIFLAANPHIKLKGVGSRLLAELEKRIPGKEVYLFTDSACTYQFYERRGFEKVNAENITLQLYNNAVDLTCLLYRKKISLASK